MNRRLALNTLLLILLTPSLATSQRYISQEGSISFFSHAPIEDIRADNSKVTSIFSSSNGMVAFSVPNREFQFEKKLMQEHFNDKYMESDRYPRSTFSGIITGFAMDAKGAQNVKARGKLTIHGIVKDIEVPGTFEVKDQNVIVRSKFKVLIADFGIEIPKLLWENVSEELEISLHMTYAPKP